MKLAVQRAVNRNDSTATLMLKNATGETSRDFETDRNYWGRFKNDAELVVSFNNIPNRPTNLSVNGKPCRPGIEHAFYVSSGEGAGQPAVLTLSAKLSDPDDNSVRASFEWDLSDESGNRSPELAMPGLTSD